MQKIFLHCTNCSISLFFFQQTQPPSEQQLPSEQQDDGQHQERSVDEIDPDDIMPDLEDCVEDPDPDDDMPDLVDCNDDSDRDDIMSELEDPDQTSMKRVRFEVRKKIGVKKPCLIIEIALVTKLPLMSIVFPLTF